MRNREKRKSGGRGKLVNAGCGGGRNPRRELADGCGGDMNPSAFVPKGEQYGYSFTFLVHIVHDRHGMAKAWWG